jgi:hypothetical protein
MFTKERGNDVKISKEKAGGLSRETNLTASLKCLV